MFCVLCTNKDGIDELQRPGVYRISCECFLVNIGETGRNLSTHLKEYKTKCRKSKLNKSAVAHHAWTYDHRIKWNKAAILAIDEYTNSRKMRELIEICNHQTTDQEVKAAKQHVARSLQ